MSRFANHTLTIKLLPGRFWFALGPGWAALAGLLAAGNWQNGGDFWTLNAPLIMRGVLLWFLADPALGTVWHLLVDRGLWRWIINREYPDRAGVRPALPYVAGNSAGYRMSALIAALRSRADGEWQTTVLLILAALGLAAWLGRPVMLYVLVSLGLALMVGRQKFTAEIAGQRFWRATATFLLPYLAGMAITGSFERNALLLGAGYWIVYLGVLRLSAGRAAGARLVIIGQAVVAGLLFALVKPIPAAIVALASIFSLLLSLRAAEEIEPEMQAAKSQPFLWLGLLAAAVALGGAV